MTLPRIVLPEFNTHRAFCLAGDSELEFDLPAGSRQGKHRRVQKMRLDEFVDKWLNGARRLGANPKKPLTALFDPSAEYSALEASSMLGMANASNINAFCRAGVLRSRKSNGAWMIPGSELNRWRQSAPEHTRFDISARLRGMSIRQLNEDTGDIQTSHVVNVCESGEKEVFEVRAGDYRVAGSKDHRVFTSSGWKTIGDISPGDFLVVRKFGKRLDDRKDPLSLKKIDGRWRSVWQRKERERLIDESPLCRRCNLLDGVEVHHIVPVYKDPSRAFDPANIALLCSDCHQTSHLVQGWQGGTYLYGALAEVTEVVSRGVEKTYDLEIAGRYPNFVANGVIVHNSRNSASSRAIPVNKMIDKAVSRPFIPSYWGKAQKGMQAFEELSASDKVLASNIWLEARDRAVEQAKELLDLGVHKQLANRLLEPFLWHTIIVSATEWDNFFDLRLHPDAQPEIRYAAEAMRKAIDNSEPEILEDDQWHLPLVDVHQVPAWIDARMVSAARCARVSYLTHDGKVDYEADNDLALRLLTSKHLSPFEHVARPGDTDTGNFKGWTQFRQVAYR